MLLNKYIIKCNGSSVMFMNSKGKYLFKSVAMLLFSILIEYCLNKILFGNHESDPFWFKDILGVHRYRTLWILKYDAVYARNSFIDADKLSSIVVSALSWRDIEAELFCHITKWCECASHLFVTYFLFISHSLLNLWWWWMLLGWLSRRK
jgi:hypothetical protein